MMGCSDQSWECDSEIILTDLCESWMLIELGLEDIIELIIGKIGYRDRFDLSFDLILKFGDIFGIFGSLVGSEDDLEG